MTPGSQSDGRMVPRFRDNQRGVVQQAHDRPGAIPAPSECRANRNFGHHGMGGWWPGGRVTPPQTCGESPGD